MANKDFIYSILSSVELEKIVNVIQEIESKTSGEVRVSIKYKRNFFERKRNIRELAIKEFFKLGMNNTRDRCGILFFILLKDHEFYILPDEGITSKLNQEFWNNLARSLENYFQNKNFFEGIIFILHECGKVLAEYFPRKIDDENELSNTVEIS